MTTRTAPESLVQQLERASIAYELIGHPRTTSAAAEARTLGLDPREVAKTVVLVTPDGFVRAVLPASERLDLRKARTVPLRRAACRSVPGLRTMRTSLRGATLGARTGRTIERSRRPLTDALRIAVLCPVWSPVPPPRYGGIEAETTENLLADLCAGTLPRAPDPSADALAALLGSRGAEVVTYAGWQRIDAVERVRGKAQGRPRVKLCSRQELLAAARGEHTDSNVESKQVALGRR